MVHGARWPRRRCTSPSHLFEDDFDFLSCISRDSDAETAMEHAAPSAGALMIGTAALPSMRRSLCQDLSPNCPIVVNLGWCDDSHQRAVMKQYRPQSCNLCLCIDHSPDCRYYASQGYCTTNSSGMRAECPVLEFVVPLRWWPRAVDLKSSRQTEIWVRSSR